MIKFASELPAAKRSVRQEIDLELKGLENVDKAGEEFEHDLVLPANVSPLHDQSGVVLTTVNSQPDYLWPSVPTRHRGPHC